MTTYVMTKLKTKQPCIRCGKELEVGTEVIMNRKGSRYFEFSEPKCELEYLEKQFKKIKTEVPDCPAIIVEDYERVIKNLKEMIR